MASHIVFEDQRIKEHEVLIAEEHSIPETNNSQHFCVPDFVITLCNSGVARNMYDMQPVVFNTHDIAVLLPNHIVSRGEFTEDYSVTIIVVSKAFYDELVTRESFSGYMKYKHHPNYHLNDEQYKKVCMMMNGIRLICESEHPKRHEMLANLFDILFYALTRYRGEENQPSEESRDAHLFNQFYDLLINHYHEHHEVGWYAEKLCLTPKYFSSVINQTTGKSAADWINEVVIVHAKRLLFTRSDMTVQQVAYELGFKENSTFCRFFRHETGLTPKQYRQGKSS